MKSDSSSSESEEAEKPPTKKPKIEKVPDESHKKLKEINKQLDSKITQSVHASHSYKNQSDAIHTKINELYKGIRTYISQEESKEPECSIIDICGYFSYLFQYEPDCSILESSRILKALKMFKTEHKESTDKNLRLLSNICHKLHLYWKRNIINESIKNLISANKPAPKPKTPEKSKDSPKKSPAKPKPQPKPKKTETNEPKSNPTPNAIDFVPDLKLRKIVCRKIAKLLQEKGLPLDQSQDHAIDAEKKLRTKDPNMKAKYIEAFKVLRRKIKSQDREGFDILKVELDIQ